MFVYWCLKWWINQLNVLSQKLRIFLFWCSFNYVKYLHAHLLHLGVPFLQISTVSEFDYFHFTSFQYLFYSYLLKLRLDNLEKVLIPAPMPIIPNHNQTHITLEFLVEISFTPLLYQKDVLGVQRSGQAQETIIGFLVLCFSAKMEWH